MITLINLTFVEKFGLKHLVYFSLFICLLGCQKKQENPPLNQGEFSDFEAKYAKGFSIEVHENFSIISVKNPWPNSQLDFRYLVRYDTVTQIPKTKFDAVIKHPVKSLIVTSTTHIPSLESLGVLDVLVGFPNTNYISTAAARKRINAGEIVDIGQNEQLNTEVVLNLKPDAIVGFSINGTNKAYDLFEKSNIPVIYNGDWVESTPLGKAEWIKFFGALLNKNKLADQKFKAIETAYLDTKKIALQAQNKPTVISGSLYKDKWYLPNGKSWQAQFITDANADYLYKNTSGNASLALSFESVLNKANQADFWLSPGNYTSYKTMKADNSHYQKFKAFKQKHIYSIAQKTGETGGVLFYELAPNRPDLVLKDLVKIFHPTLLKDYQPHFFSPLE